MWSALLADMGVPYVSRKTVYSRHCERSEAIQSIPGDAKHRHSGHAQMLRVWRSRNDGNERTYGVSTARPTSLPFCRSTSASLALASGIGVTGIGAIFLARTRSSSSCGLAQIADIAALDGDRLDRDQRQRPGRAAAEQADDHELAALGQAVEPELRGLGIADEIDHGADRLAGLFGELLQRVGRAAVDGRERAGLLGRLALARIDIDDDGALAAHRLQQRQRHQAEAAGAEDHDRRVEVRLRPSSARCRW